MAPRPPKIDNATLRLHAQMKAGSRRSANDLIKRLEPELLARARRLVAGRQRILPEDLMQMTWERALSKDRLLRFESRRPGSLRAWLARIQQRAWVDHLRKGGTMGRGASVSDRSLDETLGTSNLRAMCPSNTESPTSSARHRDLVEICRQELNEREWEVWRRIEIDGLSTPEVAQAMGASESAVRSIFFRARGKIIRRIGRDLE